MESALTMIWGTYYHSGLQGRSCCLDHWDQEADRQRVEATRARTCSNVLTGVSRRLRVSLTDGTYLKIPVAWFPLISTGPVMCVLTNQGRVGASIEHINA